MVKIICYEGIFRKAIFENKIQIYTISKLSLLMISTETIGMFCITTFW